MSDLRVEPVRNEFRRWALAALGLTCVSFYGAADRLVWGLEALPVLFFAGAAWCWSGTPSRFLARWMFLHAVVLLVGAHYTYAEVPAGHVVAGWLGQTRNPYDRLGHLMQGLVPALMLREYLVRTLAVRSGRFACVVGLLGAVAFSACYEIFEWFAAVAIGADAEKFLAMQGFVWDTQADMLCALLGATLAMTCLVRAHDRSLREVTDSPLLFA